LVWNDVYFWPLCKIAHSDEKLSVSVVATLKRSCYDDGDSFERSSYVVLVHLAPIPCPWAAAGCTGVTLPAPFLYICSCLEPVEFAELYSRFYWRPGDLLTVHHVVRLARPLLCSEGWLFGLF
jgi:hypothetical protein